MKKLFAFLLALLLSVSAIGSSIADGSPSTNGLPFDVDEVRPFVDGIAWFRNSNMKYGYINDKWQTICEACMSYAGDSSEGIARVYLLRGNKESYGFIAADGKIISEPQWDDAGGFHEGLAWVRSGDKYGFIDQSGNLVIDLAFDDVNSFYEGLAAVKQGNQYGYIDRNGQVVIPFEWNSASNFNGGLAPVRKYDLYGYIDTNGELVIQPQWESASPFCDGRARVTDEYYTSSFIDQQGQIVMPSVSYYNFSEGLIQFNDKNNGLIGFMNTDGEIVIEAQFAVASSFSNGMSYVSIREDDSYFAPLVNGIINTQGEYIIEPRWESVLPYREGVARISVKNDDGIELYGFIDTNGNIVVPPVYLAASEFSDGYAAVWAKDNGIVTPFLIDLNGNIYGRTN